MEREGFEPYSRPDLQLRIDRTIRFNVGLLPEAGLSEDVVVVATPPTVDVGSSTQGVSVDTAQLRNLALIRALKLREAQVR